ncbi:PEP-CTERM-box response regulator transcription factor [Motiliproteus coralliicola]|uniref:PEP-CTERM-box response regulator transcription factor n=1 Tax=Motiliproteus coralliicola TaxID=2283196 RepID=A0A369WZ45_9GAMM|nr:PEP-CTERM-box response regulator transcription factor [Motiliproteus coralliicola]RDE24785.1 PEP-CTERM-box response regulator transcription factor [Motiliproteus coralliicola]
MSQSKERKVLLVVEDDLGLQKQLKWCFDQYQLVFAEDENSAISALRRYEPEVVTLDLGLPPDPANATIGLGILEQILALAPQTKVIVVTGNDDQSNAVKAVGMGAYDFYQKPMDPDVLGLIVDRAFKLAHLESENRRLAASATPLDGLIAASDEMREVCKMVERVAPADISAMVLGESGTGKEVVARAIHGLSDRNEGRFVAINCASIPENLLESELFGYEKGAFTGAAKQTPGKIETANGGTLFLDEIGDMPLQLQAKLLRFLQEKTVERIGGREEIPVDVRILSATHQNLEQMIVEGSFREDLFYRLSEITINIPPLRERPGDAVVIARVLLDRFASAQGRQLRGFTDKACQAIAAFRWPGNIRELENRVKRAVIMADGQQVTEVDLGLTAPETAEELPFNLKQAREEAERRVVLRALVHADNNISRASEMLGVTRPTLYSLLSKHQIQVSSENTADSTEG